MMTCNKSSNRHQTLRLRQFRGAESSPRPVSGAQLSAGPPGGSIIAALQQRYDRSTDKASSAGKPEFD